VSRRILLAAAAAVVTLGGCSLAPATGQQAIYDFGLESPAGAVVVPAKLSLADVSAHSALQTSAILYRLAYRDPARVESYALSRWSAPPAELLTQRLRLALSGKGGETFSMATEGLAADYALRVHLEAFEQVVDAPGQCRGVARARASLANAERRLKSQRVFQAERPCPSVDAPGAAHALAGASDALIAEVLQWVAEETARR